MSSTKNELFRRTRVRFLGEIVLGQTLPTSRSNSELPFPLELELTYKKNKIIVASYILTCIVSFYLNTPIQYSLCSFLLVTCRR